MFLIKRKSDNQLVVKKELLFSSGQVSSMTREQINQQEKVTKGAKTLTELDHEYISKIYDYKWTSDTSFTLLMEYCEVGSILDIIDRRVKKL